MAVRHNVVFSPMLSIALAGCPAWKAARVSIEKVEKVVSAPRNPAPANSANAEGVPHRCQHPASRPMSSEPETLTSSVPQGKALPKRSAHQSETPWRHSAPSAPPAATQSISAGIISVSPPCGSSASGNCAFRAHCTIRRGPPPAGSWRGCP